MDDERWQESLSARNTLAANQAIYAAWSAAWTAEATEYTINIYKHFTSRGQRCPYTLQIVDAFSRDCAVNTADAAMYTSDVLEEAFYEPSGGAWGRGGPRSSELYLRYICSKKQQQRLPLFFAPGSVARARGWCGVWLGVAWRVPSP